MSHSSTNTNILNKAQIRNDQKLKLVVTYFTCPQNAHVDDIFFLFSGVAGNVSRKQTCEIKFMYNQYKNSLEYNLYFKSAQLCM